VGNAKEACVPLPSAKKNMPEPASVDTDVVDETVMILWRGLSAIAIEPLGITATEKGGASATDENRVLLNMTLEMLLDRLTTRSIPRYTADALTA
jgi:hypothetical protein